MDLQDDAERRGAAYAEEELALHSMTVERECMDSATRDRPTHGHSAGRAVLRMREPDDEMWRPPGQATERFVNSEPCQRKVPWARHDDVMGSDWVATAITGAVGFAGMFWTYKGTQSQIKGQMNLARSERQQRRQEESYGALLLLVAEADDWAYQLMLNPAATSNDKPYPYPPKIYQRTISTHGVLSMYWSPRMRQLVSELQGHMTTAFEAWLGQQAALSSLDASGTPQPSVVTTLEAFMAAKEAISETAERVKDQAGDELGDRHTGHAEEHSN